MKIFTQASSLLAALAGVNAYAAESESRAPTAAMREARLTESPNGPARRTFQSRSMVQGSPLPVSLATVASTIVALPITISEPGTYVIDQDLIMADSSLPAIRIDANDVTLDCQGNSVRPTYPYGSTWGVTTTPAKTGVTVTNCVIEDFVIGIHGGVGGTGLQALNNDVRNASIGIYLAGNDTVIAGNRVVATNYALGLPDRSIGIMLSSFDGTSDQPSTGAVIQDNVIAGITAGSQQAIGIEVVGSQGAMLLGNKILDLSATGPGAIVHGISLRASYRWPKPPGQDVLTTGTIMRGNELMIRQHPLNTFAHATDGIALEAAECVGNLNIGFAGHAFAGCLTSADNIEVPTLFPVAVNGSQPRVPRNPGSSPSATAASVAEPAVERRPVRPERRIRSRPGTGGSMEKGNAVP